MPIIANMQLKNAFSWLVFPHMPFRITKRYVTHCNIACFSLQNDPFHKVKRPVL